VGGNEPPTGTASDPIPTVPAPAAWPPGRPPTSPPPRLRVFPRASISSRWRRPTAMHSTCGSLRWQRSI